MLEAVGYLRPDTGLVEDLLAPVYTFTLVHPELAVMTRDQWLANLRDFYLVHEARLVEVVPPAFGNSG